jgi:phosphomannomutase
MWRQVNRSDRDRGQPMARKLALFDFEGALFAGRGAGAIEPAARELLADLQRRGVTVGVVGGADARDMEARLGAGLRPTFVFADDGIVAYRDGRLLGCKSIAVHLGEARLQSVLNFCLRYISLLEIPVKRGTFVEFRNGLLSVSPIGRDCTPDEASAFERYDAEKAVRARMIDAIQKRFADYDLSCSLRGPASFDVRPRGWDRTQCLRYVLPDREFDEIHFFGSPETSPELLASPAVVGHAVAGHGGGGGADAAARARAVFGLD